MFSNAFSKPNLGKWIIPGAGMFWLLGCFFLLKNEGLDFKLALIDSSFFAGIFVAGIWILDLIFSLYSPKGRNTWLIVLMPAALSWISVFGHQLAFDWWFPRETDYQQSLQRSFYLRWLVLGMAEQFFALLALIVTKLERQEELNRREVQLSELSKEAELAQLRQQLQPHFLFNSLNSINALVISQPQKAREMVLLLSDFLRGTIRKDTQSKVTLEEELNYLRMYLDIEKVRFGHRLQVNFSIEKGVENSKLPQLLIQPLLENAIKHGLYGRLGEVRIELICKKQGNYLGIEIRNPFDSDYVATGGVGFGINSIERRLYLLFGRKDLMEKSVGDGEFLVKIKIPQFS